MQQIQELLEILKQTPEMALWALSIYFLFILLKLASWVYALKLIAQQFIKRFFDYRDKLIDHKNKALNNKRGVEISELFENQKITGVDYKLLLELLEAAKGENTTYFHESDLRRAIDILKHNQK